MTAWADTGAPVAPREPPPPLPWHHPLATQEARAIAARLAEGGDPAEALDRLDWFEGVTIALNAEGEEVAIAAAGAVEIERWALDGGAITLPPESPRMPTRVADDVLAALLDPTDALEVWLTPWDDPGAGLVPFAELEIAILRGEIRSDAAWLRHRAAWIRLRLERGQAIATALAAALPPEVEVVELDPWLGRVRVWASPDAILRAAGDEVAHAISFPAVEHDDCGPETAEDGYLSINGAELRELVQARQFHEAGFRGLGETFATMENEGAKVHRNHVGFTDANGTRRMFNCGAVVGAAATCDDLSYPRAQRERHATNVNSVLISDISQGQDTLHPFVVGSLFGERRSGLAREGESFAFAGDYAVLTSALAGTSPAASITILNRSSTDGIDANVCAGISTNDRNANAIFEAGIPVFNSTGNANANVNQIPAAVQPCNINAPGGALGVFAVNTYDFTVDGDPVANESTGTGGYLGRSILAISAPTDYRYPNTHHNTVIDLEVGPTWETRYGGDVSDDGVLGDDDADTDTVVSQLERGVFNGSSAATPVVAGTAALIRQQYLAEIGTNINNPGVLYALMLLMGDRRALAGGTLSVGYDNRLGAGRLRARMLNQAGLDQPAGVLAGSVCVGNGEAVAVPVKPHPTTGLATPLDAGVDFLKVVTWTYSKAHDDGGVVPDVELQVIEGTLQNGQTMWQEVPPRAEDLSADNKKRVMIVDNVANRYFKLRLTGTNVGDATGANKWPTCSAGRIRVWYAWMYEDEAREPGEVPECVESEVTP